MKPIQEQEWTCDETPYGAGTRVVLKEGAAIIAVFPASEPSSARKRKPRARLAAAAPDMARALTALEARGEECLRSLPGHRSLDDLASMETTIAVPTSVLRDALAALRKAGVI